jgi:hypothetical protein
MPPALKAKSRQTMWAFGNHICVSSAKKHLTTHDSGVVTIFEQECVWRPNDQRLVLAKLEYVNGLKKY